MISKFITIWAQFHRRSTYRFCAHRSQKRKKDTGDLPVFFTLLGSTSAKAVRRTLMKLTPDRVITDTARTCNLSGNPKISSPLESFVTLVAPQPEIKTISLADEGKIDVFKTKTF